MRFVTPLRRRAAGRSPGRAARWPRALLWLVVGVAFVGAAWIAVTGLLARHELSAAQRGLAGLEQSAESGVSPAGDAADPKAALRRVNEHARRAHAYTTGPAWYVAAHTPLAGAPMESVRGMAATVDDLTRDVLTPLARTALTLTAQSRSGHGFDVGQLERSATELRRAAQVAATARIEVGTLPGHTWMPPVDRARERLIRQLDRIIPMALDVAGRLQNPDIQEG